MNGLFTVKGPSAFLDPPTRAIIAMQADFMRLGVMLGTAVVRLGNCIKCLHKFFVEFPSATSNVDKPFEE